MTLEDLHRQVPADWYYRSIKENIFQRFWHTRRFTEIRKFIEPMGGTILDIGSADGTFTSVILESSKATKVIGIDVNEKAVAWAKDHWSRVPTLTFQVGDAHHLNFPDRYFDAVFCLEALEHITNPNQVFKEIDRVLKPSGYALFLVPTDNILFRIIWYFWTRGRGRIWQDCHVNSFRGDSLRNIVEPYLHVDQTHRFLFGMLYIVKVRKYQ
jgi:ubiquinone/menaquinone biosynthesis C-methylase UbiE